MQQTGLQSMQMPTSPSHHHPQPCLTLPPSHLPLALLWDGSGGSAGTAEFTPGLSSGPWHPRVDPGLSRATSPSKLGLQYTDLGGATSHCPRLSFHPTHILSRLNRHLGSSQCPCLVLAKYSRVSVLTLRPLSSPPNPNLQMT